MIQRVEIVVWRGDVETLALRLGCAPADLLALLRTTGRDANRTPIKIEVNLGRTAPVFAAAKRALLRPADGEAADALLHLADIRW